MDPLDALDDVCDRCRHTLNDDDVCPSCGWQRERFIGPLPPHEPDLGSDLPQLDDCRYRRRRNTFHAMPKPPSAAHANMITMSKGTSGIEPP